MSKRRPSGEYDVGFAKPPRAGQFQPGRSGNPSGRRKTPPSIGSELHAELNRRHAIAVNGKPVRIPMRSVILKQLLKKAAAGEPWALRMVFGLDDAHRKELLGSAAQTEVECSKEDEQLLDSFIKQLTDGEQS